MIHCEKSSINISVCIRFTFRENTKYTGNDNRVPPRTPEWLVKKSHQDATRVCSCTTRRVSFRPPGCPDFIVPGALITSKCFRRFYQIAAPRTGIALLFADEGNHAKDSNDDRAAKEALVKSVDDTTTHFISN